MAAGVRRNSCSVLLEGDREGICSDESIGGVQAGVKQAW